VELIKGKPIGKHIDDLGNPDTRSSAIPGQHLSALISTDYIFGFRKDNAIFFNRLSAFRESLRVPLMVHSPLARSGRDSRY
jgi:hypothetical protein